MIHCKKYGSDFMQARNIQTEIISPGNSCKTALKVYQIHVLNSELHTFLPYNHYSVSGVNMQYLSNTLFICLE